MTLGMMKKLLLLRYVFEFELHVVPSLFNAMFVAYKHENHSMQGFNTLQAVAWSNPALVVVSLANVIVY